MEGRQSRTHAELVVQLLEGADRRYEGVTRDLSMSGFSAFLKRTSEGILRESVDYSLLTVHEIEGDLTGRKLSAVLEMGLSIGPVAVSLIRAEHSWRKDFDMFAAFSFESLNESDGAAITKYTNEHSDLRKHVSVEPEEKLGWEKTGEADVVRIAFPARHFYLTHMRDLCEKLALQGGFNQNEALKIKVAFDEVLTNAFKHGCIHYGRDKIDVQISLDTAGVFVCVRDPGGTVFDYKRYREFDKKFPDSSRTGLHLVDKFTDGWSVNTKPGKYTEVAFFKNRSQEGGK